MPLPVGKGDEYGKTDELSVVKQPENCSYLALCIMYENKVINNKTVIKVK